MSGQTSCHAVVEKATVSTLKGHTNKISALSWNCTGNLLCSVSEDKTARVWGFERSELKLGSVLKDHRDPVTQCAWGLQNSNMLATATKSEFRTWDVRDSRSAILVKNSTTRSKIINICWSHDDTVLTVGTKHAQHDAVCFYDARNLKLLKQEKFRQNCNHMAWSRDGYFFLTASPLARGGAHEGSVQVYKFDGSNLEKLCEVPAHTHNCLWIDFSRDGRCFVTGGADGLVDVFGTEDLACLQVYDRLRSSVRSLSVSFDGRYVAVGSKDEYLDIFAAADGSRIRKESYTNIDALAWHPSQAVLAFVGEGRVRRDDEIGAFHLLSPKSTT